MAAAKRAPTTRPAAATAARAAASPSPAAVSGFARGNGAMARLFRVAKDDEECPKCAGKLHRKAGAGRDPDEVPPIVYDVLRSPGRPLDGATRLDMEQRFGGADFRGVRVHTDARAAESAEAVNAKAYTVGQNIVFGGGRLPRPGSDLLAHELTHTLHSPAWGGAGGGLRIAPPDSTTERAVDAAARTVMSGLPGPTAPSAGPAGVGLYRRVGDPNQVPPGLSCPVAKDLPANPIASIEFGKDSSALGPDVAASVAAFLVSWRALGSPTPIRLDGFASTDGPEGLNWTLSCDRAAAIARELMAPTGGAMAGVPAGQIVLFAQGETDEFSATSLVPNRRVTISTPVPVPPSPQPPGPNPQPAPQFVCGPDVTEEVKAAVAKTKTTFGGWSTGDKDAACDALDSLTTGGFAWDIVELHNNAWILTYRPACASAGANPACGSSVQVGTDCYYAGSPNYVIYGVMCELCNSHYAATGRPTDANRFTEAQMRSWINFYKGTGPLGLSTPSGNFGPSNDWAVAGYTRVAGRPLPRRGSEQLRARLPDTL